ncbi:hypothetical protein ABFS83_11G083300 [Erythranthe nasuta]
MKNVPYVNIVGAFMYAMVCTRPDLSHAVKNLELDKLVVGYVDSNYKGDLDKQRSTTRYVFTMAGGPFRWRPTLQSTVALSTSEAEYMAVTEAFIEAIWMHGLLNDLGIAQKHVPCDVRLLKIGTAENHADMLTKAVTRNKLIHRLDLINIG